VSPISPTVRGHAASTSQTVDCTTGRPRGGWWVRYVHMHPPMRDGVGGGVACEPGRKGGMPARKWAAVPHRLPCSAPCRDAYKYWIGGKDHFEGPTARNGFGDAIRVAQFRPCGFAAGPLQKPRPHGGCGGLTRWARDPRRSGPVPRHSARGSPAPNKTHEVGPAPSAGPRLGGWSTSDNDRIVMSHAQVR